MNRASPGIERIFSWSSIDSKSRVVILVSILLICSIPHSSGQETITGWNEAESWTDHDLNAAVIHGELAWAFGDSGIVRFSEDSGATWQNHTNLGDVDLISADSYENSMAVLSSEGIIYMKNSLESEWITIDSSQTGMKSIALTGEQSLIIVGNTGLIWQYTDQTWWNRTKSFTEGG